MGQPAAMLVKEWAHRTGYRRSRAAAGPVGDVNGDGLQDAVPTFLIDQTGIACGDAEVE